MAARRPHLKRILILGSGPIVIGQAAEFGYSGTQAVRALREEGYRVILVNSNPATIMPNSTWPAPPASSFLVVRGEMSRDMFLAAGTYRTLRR